MSAGSSSFNYKISYYLVSEVPWRSKGEEKHGFLVIQDKNNQKTYSIQHVSHTCEFRDFDIQKTTYTEKKLLLCATKDFQLGKSVKSAFEDISKHVYNESLTGYPNCCYGLCDMVLLRLGLTVDQLKALCNTMQTIDKNEWIPPFTEEIQKPFTKYFNKFPTLL